MKYLKFFNSKIYHILLRGGENTLCGISNTSSEIFDSYSETNYPLPQQTDAKPTDSKLCPKCQAISSTVTDVTDKTPFFKS